MVAKPEKPDAFLSYTRFDDRRGRISDFRTWLSDAVEEVSGQSFEIFQDVDDESGIALGKKWQHELDRMLDEARFFIPILTPKFFASPACRDELKKFLELEAKSGRDDLILPIYWIDCPVLDEAPLLARDELAQAISTRQRWDWRELRFEDFEQPAAQRELVALARQIERARRALRLVADNKQQVASVGGHNEQVSVAPTTAPPSAGTGLNDIANATTKSSKNLLLPPGTVFRDMDEPWCPEMVVISPGVFNMGSPKDEAERFDDEGPQHRVEIEQPFALGRYPITRGEFAAFVKATGHEGKGARIWTGKEWETDEHADWQSPGFAQTDRHPVVCVSHEDALAYLAWLSDRTGQHYVLPSEAMWEYACRAGTTTPFWTGATITTDQANYHGYFSYGKGKKGAFREATTEVDSFAANFFNLHDMHGNAWGWCADHWNKNYNGAPADGAARQEGKGVVRVLRGGSWLNVARDLRSARRDALGPDYRSNVIGFRCARVQE